MYYIWRTLVYFSKTCKMFWKGASLNHSLFGIWMKEVSQLSINQKLLQAGWIFDFWGEEHINDKCLRSICVREQHTTIICLPQSQLQTTFSARWSSWRHGSPLANPRRWMRMNKEHFVDFLKHLQAHTLTAFSYNHWSHLVVSQLSYKNVIIVTF